MGEANSESETSQSARQAKSLKNMTSMLDGIDAKIEAKALERPRWMKDGQDDGQEGDKETTSLPAWCGNDGDNDKLITGTFDRNGVFTLPGDGREKSPGLQRGELLSWRKITLRD